MDLVQKMERRQAKSREGKGILEKGPCLQDVVDVRHFLQNFPVSGTELVSQFTVC